MIVEIRASLQLDGTVLYFPCSDETGDYGDPIEPKEAFRLMLDGITVTFAAPNIEDKNSNLETIPSTTLTKV